MPCLTGNSRGEEERWTISYQVEGRGVGSTAVALGSGDGLTLVTVAAHGGDFSRTAVQWGGKQVPAKLAGYDVVSRLGFFRPLEAGKARAPEWVARAPVKPGTILTAQTGRMEIVGKTEGWVNRVGDKVLPLALMQVGFGGAVPVPGTPLLDEAGKVAGVVFQKAENGDSIYAIPAEAVHRVARDVRAWGKLVRGWLGVSLKVENEEPEIVRVFARSPAAEAGIREKDLILKIGGRDVSNYAEVANAFFYVIPGEPVDVEVKRGPNLLAFTLVPVAERPQ